MIVWINGAFGAGKTTCAFELHHLLPNSFVYDPENIGYFIRKNTPRVESPGDFQDFCEWREFNYRMLKKIDRDFDGVILVPMTIVKRQYYDEIIQRLVSDGIDVRHIILYASHETLLKRLNKRLSRNDTWAKRSIYRCIDAFDHEITEIKIMTDTMTISEVVSKVAQICDLPINHDQRGKIQKFMDRYITLIRHIRG